MRILRYRVPLAVGWSLFLTTALCLPGSEFPKITWLSGLWLDKWAHLLLFFVLVFLWGRVSAVNNRGPSIYKWIALAGFVYGALMELAQHYMVPFRTFDVIDIVANGIGCLAGYILLRWRYIKK